MELKEIPNDSSNNQFPKMWTKNETTSNWSCQKRLTRLEDNLNRDFTRRPRIEAWK